MFKKFFLVVLIFLAFGCRDKRKIPDNALSKEQMASILIDIHILESKIQGLRLRRDSSQILFNTFEREIFQEHGVDPEVYKRSFEYYLEELKEMEEIYGIVIDSLNVLEKSASKAKSNNYQEKYGSRK